jgi:hypothetical protein
MFLKYYLSCNCLMKLKQVIKRVLIFPDRR